MKTSVLLTFAVGLRRVVPILNLLAMGMAMACPRPIWAATLRWTGGHAASANWSRPANWDTGTVPADGDTLVFPAGAARLANNNDLVGLNLATLRFTGAVGGYVLSGNGVFVTNGVAGAHVTGANTIDLTRITLGADLPFNAPQAGAELVVASEVRLNGNNLTLNSAGLITVSGAIVGNGTVTKTNSGSAKLSGSAANTFSGDVFVDEGTLLMGKAGGLAIPNRLIVGLSSPGAPPQAFAENLLDDQVNQVTVNWTGLWDVGPHIEEVSDLVIQRSGNVGSLPPLGKLRIGINGDVTVIANADYTTPPATMVGEVELLLGTHEFRVEPLSALSIVATISGIGGITKTHGGTLALKSANSFSGLVTVKDDGTLIVEHSGALGSTLSGTRLDDNAILTINDVSVLGEKLILNSPGQADGSGEFVFPALDFVVGVHSWTGDISLERDTTIGAYSEADKLILSGAISGPGGFTKLDRGVVQLAGATPNTYLGTTVVKEGVLELAKSAAGSPAVPGMLIVGDGEGGFHADIARSLGDDQVNRVTVNSSGYWDLGGFEEEVSALTLNQGGDVRTGPAGNLRLGIGADVLVAPSLAPIQDASHISGNLELLLGAHTFDVGEGLTLPGDATELIVDADVAGLGGITKEGPGDMLLSGGNSYQAATKVSAGELRVTSGTALGATLTGTTVENDATLWLQGNVQVSGETLTLNSTGLTGLNSRPALRASGPGNAWQGYVNFQINSRVGVLTNGFLDLPLGLAGAGSLIKEDVGTLRFSCIDLSGFSGNIFVNEGLFELNHGFVPATIPANLGAIVVGTTNGAPHSAILRNLNNAQVGIDIPLVGPYTWPVLVNGSGLWDLNGHSDFTSLLGLHQGGDVITGPNGIIAILIGLLADSGPAPGNDPARISGNLHLRTAELPIAVLPGDSAPGQRSDLLIDANVFGGGFVKSGTGDLQLAGDNSFNGPVTVNNGTLRANHPNALGNGVDPITVVSNATLWLQADIAVGNRPLSLDSDGQTGPAGHEPALNVSGLCSWAGDVLFARDTRISVTTGGALDLSGALSGPGNLTKEERGLLTFSGNRPNSYSGRTSVNAGRLVLAKAPARRHFAGPLTVGDGDGGPDADVVECASPGISADLLNVEVQSSGLLLVKEDASFGFVRGAGHLQVDAILNVGRNNGSGGISGPITGSGVINKYGTGVLSLDNTNTIAGFVAFDGSLIFSGTQSNSAVGLIGSSALIGGAGRIGPLLATEGTVRPGDAKTGELTTGNIIGKPAVTFALRLDGPRPGEDYDRLRVNGTVNLGDATLKLSSTFVPTSGQVFTIIDNDGTDPITGTFAGFAEGDLVTVAGTSYAVSYKGGASGNDVTLTAQAPPLPCPDPLLSVRRLTSAIELSWPTCPSNSYQIAWTTNLTQWQILTPPLAPPATNGVMMWTNPAAFPYQFFQLIVRPLATSPVPTNAGTDGGRTLVPNDFSRWNPLVIPGGFAKGASAPLPLALQDYSRTACAFVANVPRLGAQADVAGPILVYPDSAADGRGAG